MSKKTPAKDLTSYAAISAQSPDSERLAEKRKELAESIDKAKVDMRKSHAQLEAAKSARIAREVLGDDLAGVDAEITALEASIAETGRTVKTKEEALVSIDSELTRRREVDKREKLDEIRAALCCEGGAIDKYNEAGAAFGEACREFQAAVNAGLALDPHFVYTAKQGIAGHIPIIYKSMASAVGVTDPKLIWHYESSDLALRVRAGQK